MNSIPFDNLNNNIKKHIIYQFKILQKIKYFYDRYFNIGELLWLIEVAEERIKRKETNKRFYNDIFKVFKIKNIRDIK